MSKRVNAVLSSRAGKAHNVELEVRAIDGRVVVEILRPRRDAKGDERLQLSASTARELMRLLQGRADESDRQAYVAAKSETLESAVAAVAEAIAE